MCYRYNLVKQRLPAVLEELNVNEELLFYHTGAYAHQALPIITQDAPHLVQLYRWTLIPHFTKDRKAVDEIWKLSMTANARAETIFEKPSFNKSAMHKRCLVPASGFFDFHHGEDGKKYPYHVMVKDDHFPDSERGFCFAGIYSHWTDPATQEQLKTFSIITQEANTPMKFIHNSKERMPVILRSEGEGQWLDPALTIEQVEEIILRPFPDALIRAHLISNMLTSRKQNQNVPEVTTPVESSNPAVPAWID